MDNSQTITYFSNQFVATLSLEGSQEKKKKVKISKKKASIRTSSLCHDKN